MNKNESNPISNDDSCESSTGCCGPTPNNSNRCSWTSVIFIIVLLLAGAVIAHSVITKQDTGNEQNLTAGILASSGEEQQACGCGDSQEVVIAAKADVPQDQAVAPKAPAVQVTPGTQEVCPVMGNPIKESVFVDYEGQRIYFCCPGCDGKFQEDPTTYLKQMAEAGVVLAKVVANGNSATETEVEGCACGGMEEQVVAAAAAEEEGCACGGMEEQTAAPVASPAADVQVVPGTQTMCPVMPTHPIKDVFVDYQGKRVYLCCAGCIEKFNAEPEKFISQMEAEGVVFAQITPDGSQAEESCCGNCEKIDTILEKLIRIEQLLEQLSANKADAKTSMPIPDKGNTIR